MLILETPYICDLVVFTAKLIVCTAKLLVFTAKVIVCPARSCLARDLRVGILAVHTIPLFAQLSKHVLAVHTTI